MKPDQHLLDQTHAAFCYVIEISGTKLGAFTECTLPAIEWEFDDVKEGGLNTYVHQLPGRRKPARLILKNGVGKTLLWDWCLQAMNGSPPKELRRTVAVRLLNGEGRDLAVWTVEKAYPVKWTGPQFKSDASSIAIQTVEFSCGLVTAELV